jgi:hypothetical protein
MRESATDSVSLQTSGRALLLWIARASIVVEPDDICFRPVLTEAAQNSQRAGSPRLKTAAAGREVVAVCAQRCMNLSALAGGVQ